MQAVYYPKAAHNEGVLSMHCAQLHIYTVQVFHQEKQMSKSQFITSSFFLAYLILHAKEPMQSSSSITVTFSFSWVAILHGLFLIYINKN